MLGEDHFDLLDSQGVLAVAYLANRQAKEAVLLLERVVATWNRVLPKNHPDLLA